MKTQTVVKGLPTQNTFLRVTPELKDRACVKVGERMTVPIWQLHSPGDGEIGYIVGMLETLQKHIRTLQEFGFDEVRPLDEIKFVEFAEAIGPLKRAGLQAEALEMVLAFIDTCGLPEATLAVIKKDSEQYK